MQFTSVQNFSFTSELPPLFFLQSTGNWLLLYSEDVVMREVAAPKAPHVAARRTVPLKSGTRQK